MILFFILFFIIFYPCRKENRNKILSSLYFKLWGDSSSPRFHSIINNVANCFGCLVIQVWLCAVLWLKWHFTSVWIIQQQSVLICLLFCLLFTPNLNSGNWCCSVIWRQQDSFFFVPHRAQTCRLWVDDQVSAVGTACKRQKKDCFWKILSSVLSSAPVPLAESDHDVLFQRTAS